MSTTVSLKGASTILKISFPCSALLSHKLTSPSRLATFAVYCVVWIGDDLDYREFLSCCNDKLRSPNAILSAGDSV